ncbi:hypothetical protein [Geomicrobium sp. JCM 19039]|uniref:hypothetical protein n=1 Tax=Geomicrobium sp. JCM 19039 TaxID=1460636 RepID=UPI00045F175C|nr:hypothetical protein [Geomicrobium sp. JCM 19039]GAK14161.1 hypothetical protein JCM19039_4058 [Geomicrobium sp. JCM 19039]
MDHYLEISGSMSLHPQDNYMIGYLTLQYFDIGAEEMITIGSCQYYLFNETSMSKLPSKGISKDVSSVLKVLSQIDDGVKEWGNFAVVEEMYIETSFDSLTMRELFLKKIVHYFQWMNVKHLYVTAKVFFRNSSYDSQHMNHLLSRDFCFVRSQGEPLILHRYSS